MEDSNSSTGEPADKHLLDWMVTHTLRTLRGGPEIKHLQTKYTNTSSEAKVALFINHSTLISGIRD